MDGSNYVITELPKPMGIVFEENDADYGGIFVQSLKEGGAAVGTGILTGHQLVGVDVTKVSALPFDEALGAIVGADDVVTLTFFTGTAEQFYGPTGASQEWLNDFLGADAAVAATKQKIVEKMED